MFILEGHTSPSKPWTFLGEFKTKQALRDRLAELQADGSPRRHWRFRQVTIVGKERSQVGLVNFPLPVDLRPRVYNATEEKDFSTRYPNMARLAPQVAAMAKKEGW